MFSRCVALSGSIWFMCHAQAYIKSPNYYILPYVGSEWFYKSHMGSRMSQEPFRDFCFSSLHGGHSNFFFPYLFQFYESNILFNCLLVANGFV